MLNKKITFLQHAIDWLGWQGGTIHQVKNELKKYNWWQLRKNIAIQNSIANLEVILHRQGLTIEDAPKLSTYYKTN